LQRDFQWKPEVEISVGVSNSCKRDRDRQCAGISTRFRLRDRNGTVPQTMLTSATIADILSYNRIPEGGEGTTIRGQFLEQNAVALIEHLKNVAARSWASRARLMCRMAAPMAPTIGADMYSHASLKLPVQIANGATVPAQPATAVPRRHAPAALTALIRFGVSSRANRIGRQLRRRRPCRRVLRRVSHPR